jgi:hypothetical protein
MRERTKNRVALIVFAVLALWTAPSALTMPESERGEQTQDSTQGSKKVTSAEQERVIAAFQDRVKEYVKLRESLEEKGPKLSKDATSEQIKAHQTAFTETVRTARSGAQRGSIFTPDIAEYIRRLIKREFKGKQRAELRESILDTETRGVTLKVNYPYPETKELTAIPPTLLLALPQLPKQIRYRFVGRYMLLMDRENYLILDYMQGALP